MSQLADRLRDSSTGRAALDRWSRFQYVPRATKVRYGTYIGVGSVVLVFGVWRLATLGGSSVDDATLQKAQQIQQQAAVEPPPAVVTSTDPGYTGPEPKTVRGGGMPGR